jgi:predicted GIY-YIG superfamily endonuclease
MDSDWVFYIIQNKNYTYAGVSPTPGKRLRQHNGEIKGGAKYTTSKGEGWEHICLVKGFNNKIEALQFEWAVKHAPPRNIGGIESRIKKLFDIINKERWTSNAPLASEVMLTICWKNKPKIEYDYELPGYVSETTEYGGT